MGTELCDCGRPEEGPLTSWSDISHYYYQHLPEFKSPEDEDGEPRWLFRGDSPRPKPWKKKNSKEGAGPLMRDDYPVLKEAFKSRLDRAFEEFEINTCREKHRIEWGLMRSFRRKAHLHTGHRADDWLERIALMAHYEAPQRMLDWTYSFFNALYFAVNGSHNKGNYIIWALNKAWLGTQAKKLEKKVIKEMKFAISRNAAKTMKKYHDCDPPRFDTKIIHFLMLTNTTPAIYNVTPYYQNERLSIQQGTLICAGTINYTWGENLSTILLEETKAHPLVKIPINLDTDERKKVLRELRSMNISQATLFPDLGGFAQSLRMRLADPEIIMPKAVPPLKCLEI